MQNNSRQPTSEQAEDFLYVGQDSVPEEVYWLLNEQLAEDLVTDPFLTIERMLEPDSRTPLQDSVLKAVAQHISLNPEELETFATTLHWIDAIFFTQVMNFSEWSPPPTPEEDAQMGEPSGSPKEPEREPEPAATHPLPILFLSLLPASRSPSPVAGPSGLQPPVRAPERDARQKTLELQFGEILLLVESPGSLYTLLDYQRRPLVGNKHVDDFVKLFQAHVLRNRTPSHRSNLSTGLNLVDEALSLAQGSLHPNGPDKAHQEYDPTNVEVDIFDDEDFMEVDEPVRDESPDESEPPPPTKSSKDKGKGRATEANKKDKSKATKSKTKKRPRVTGSESEPGTATSAKGKAGARPPAKKQKQRETSPETSDASRVRKKNPRRPLVAGNNSTGVHRWISGTCRPCERKQKKCVFGFYKGIEGHRRFSCDECIDRKIKCVKNPLAQGQVGFLPPDQDKFLPGEHEFLGCGNEGVPRSGDHIPQAEYLSTPAGTTRIPGAATVLQLSQAKIEELEREVKKLKKQFKKRVGKLELRVQDLEDEKADKGKKKPKKDDKGKGKAPDQDNP
ncbi:hypothetical protein BDZ89DRAFT_1139726 [Hymenopellis radicata]|nr:hypothetical protein BDZ89DRAFT_1139726 [Hymenopellis radicata]